MSKKKAHNGLGAIFPPQKTKQISLPELKKIIDRNPIFSGVSGPYARRIVS